MEGVGPVSAFYALSALAIVSALLVMAARTIIHSVLFLIVMFVSLAALFVLLSADFVAVAQLLVYAGAIGVLVVFAILLTPPRELRSMETNFVGPGLLAGAVIAGTVIFVVFQTNWATVGVSENPFGSTVEVIGQALLNRWALPFEVASVLLLAAMIGAIVLVRGRSVDLRDEPATPGAALVRRER